MQSEEKRCGLSLRSEPFRTASISQGGPCDTGRGTLDRAGREGERAFCLQAWNGDTGHTIDRIGRGTIHVEACCMSMLGGIQPGRRSPH